MKKLHVLITKPTNNSYQCINLIRELLQLDEDLSSQLSRSERRLSAILSSMLSLSGATVPPQSKAQIGLSTLRLING